MAISAELIEVHQESQKAPGRFARGNQFASSQYRAGLKRDPHHQVQRALRDTITKLRTGKMAPGVAMALVALFRLQLELIDRSQMTTTLEGMQNEINRLTALVGDLVDAAAARGAR